jgi:RNA polymerase sigma-70 factor (ECF subfamily)
MSTHSSSSISDRELIDRISLGDQAAFRELYSRHHAAIYNYILRLTHQVTTSEDLLQEVYLAIWQGAQKFRGTSSPKTWIFRIAHYQTVSWLRKQKKHRQTIDNLDAFELPSGDPSPEDDLIGKWQTKQLQHAIDSLSPKHRAVIELTFLHGFAYREIAEIMECPIGTVKSRMSYALQYLYRILAANNEAG